MRLFENPLSVAEYLGGVHFLSAEMIYRPRPDEPRARAVFDHAFRARLGALNAEDGLLLLVDSTESLESLRPLLTEGPPLRAAALVVNPAPLINPPDTPYTLGWDTPAAWHALQTTDRWARLLAALAVVSALDGGGGLVLPALDAVYGRPLLRWLEAQSMELGRGVRAAVSPVTPFQHYRVPGASIPLAIIEALNSAFNRDETLPARLASGQAQGVWGKMSLIPFAACVGLAAALDTAVWEDDKEIDRALRERGVATRGLWQPDPALYHQVPPVFDRAGLKAVIGRTLHYSLNIPAARPAGSSFLAVTPPLRFCAEDSIWYHEGRQLADALIGECLAEIAARVAHSGASWVDWGRYRYVARIGVPGAEMWAREHPGLEIRSSSAIMPLPHSAIEAKGNTSQ